MSAYDDFENHIRKELEDVNWLGMYNNVKETGEYDRIRLRKIILLLIYHLEINDNPKPINMLIHYLEILSKEKLYKDILLEQLLFIIAKCEQIYSKKSNSPSTIPGMYI